MGLGRIKRLPKTSRRDRPLWQGPQEDGITQSLLSRYLVCPERFRILTIEGLRPLRQFSRTAFYGSLWHLCEEYHAMGKPWQKPLEQLVQTTAQVHVESVGEIQKWYEVCRTQFPIYQNYWSEHSDVVKRTPLAQEQTFKVPYQLPSRRTVLLRGMWDSVDLIEKGIWLQENKTKGEVEEQKLRAELPNNLQTMVYLTALSQKESVEFDGANAPVRGVRYNVVRRPLSGGKFSISQSKGRLVNVKVDGRVVRGDNGKPLKARTGAETPKQFYERLGGIIEENSDHFFMRLKCRIYPSDLKRFQLEVLNPVLDNLCDWWEWMEWCWERPDVDVWNGKLRNEIFPGHVYRHYRMPYGIYNPLAEGRGDEWNEYITNGSQAGMEKVETLFGELE